MPDNRDSLLQPVPEGGYAIGGRTGLELGQPNLLDKLVGSLDSFLGTITCSPYQAEVGKLRRKGGKDAVEGKARIPA